MLEAKSDFEKKQKLIESENKKQLERQRAVTYSSIILLVSLSIILFLIRRNINIQKKANKELVKINALKDQVFSIIGHDLKAPINTLQELLDLYKNKAITAEQISEITPRLKNNVDHSAFTLNNLLFWAQNQMSGISVAPQNVNIKRTTAEIVSLYKERINKKNITIDMNVSNDIVVSIDPEHLKIVLRNIVLNAIKYSEIGGQIIFKSREEKQRVVFSICDNGIGMTQEIIDTITKGGTPNSRPGTLNEKGTGLGLNICNDLIMANNGYLTIESQPNQGSCFHIDLPK